ncbi:type II secretion system protein GspG [bacterium]|nr:type II secretion system protein GspG [bacterium]
MTTRRGFTLIELLIVVAIIAILAAIAVPNFLEAQTRSKVSRAKADLRTLATGLESYRVDNNNYPYCENIGNTPWLPPGGTPRSSTTEKPGGLTSPIAYLTSLPNDVFKHQIDGGPSVSAPLYYERPGFGYVAGNNNHQTLPVWVPWELWEFPGPLLDDSPDYYTMDVSRTPTRWVLYSFGPDLDDDVVVNGTVVTRSRWNVNNLYDPTNGTITPGNIVRFPGGINYP